MDIPSRIFEAGFTLVDQSLSSASYYAESTLFGPLTWRGIERLFSRN